MDNIDTLLEEALNQASIKKIDFLEARWGLYESQYLTARDNIMTEINDNISQGIGIRVFYMGAWGFASAPINNKLDIGRLANKATEAAKASALLLKKPLILSPIKPHILKWSSPFKKDPFSVPLKEKTDLLLEINGILNSIKSIREAYSYMIFNKTVKRYVNTLGSKIDQTIIQSSADYTAKAVGNDRCETRDYQSMVRAEGYEAIDPDQLIGSAPEIAREAVEQLSAPSWDKDKADIILMPNHTRLVIHETIGHATELDRILGWESDYAGTSFATPEKLNNYRYGSPIFNITADRTQEHGMASCAFDDEGIPAKSWKIIENGILCNYSTTRDTAPFIHSESNGCAFADHWSSYPILRMANTSIDPGPEDAPDLSQLIEDTKDGILIDGMASFSIDHQRINFQFSGDYARRIRNGELKETLHNIVYEGTNPSFWNSVDAICNPGEWRQYGLSGCAKGQPVQVARLTHGSSPLRLRNINIRRNK